MKSFIKPVLLAGVLATVGFSAFSQGPGMGMGAGGPMMGQGGGMMGADCPMADGMRQHKMGNMDPAKMQARMDQRNAWLKTQLKLTPAQEGSWTSYTAAMKPSADMMAKRSDYAEMAKLPTPERIDKMRALRAQHMGEMTLAMDKRGDATKVFYATLTPEQQKVFDANAMHPQGQGGRMGGGRGPAPAKP